MGFIEHVREAILNIYLAKIRSLLAILGVLVGTGSVVALISSSQLATAHALEQFKTLGTNLLGMSLQDDPSKPLPPLPKQLQLEDIPNIISASDQIVKVAPYTQLYQSLVFSGTTFDGQVIGATEDLSAIAKIYIARGRFVSMLDKENFFCVIGDKIASKIMSMGIDPLYKQIQVGKSFFTIVGIAKPWEPNLFLFVDVDNGIIIPVQASYLLSKDAHISDLLFRLIQKPNIQLVQDQLTKKLQALLPNKQIFFRNPEQIIDIIAKQRKTFTWLLGAIGGISLIVGGIGVMNIMLVSVVERRQEIGIRMAIGARPADIMSMFLIESIILTSFGGLVGIVFGILISMLLGLATRWGFHIYLIPPILGFGVSVIVGVISGYYPALRASRLDPIKTLQGE